MTTWHKGPPLHVGWWNASSTKSFKYVWRWWNGSHWSQCVHCTRTASEAAEMISAAYGFERIEWCDYWPENARVPRVDPT